MTKFFGGIPIILLLFSSFTVLPVKKGWKRPEKIVEQELNDAKDTKKFSHFHLTKRIDHLAEVLVRQREWNKSKDTKSIIPACYLAEKLELVRKDRGKNPDSNEMELSLASFFKQLEAFRLNLCFQTRVEHYKKVMKSCSHVDQEILLSLTSKKEIVFNWYICETCTQITRNLVSTYATFLEGNP